MKMREVSEWHAERHAEYMAIPVEHRLMAARIGLGIAERRVRRLEAERDRNGPTAWLARRQLPHALKQLAERRREIEEFEREMGNGD